MSSQPEHESSARDTYLVIVLVLLVGIPCFVFFSILTGGLLLIITFSALGLVILGLFHYLLWGRSFSQQMEGEREEAEWQEELLKEWPYEDRP